MVSMRTSTLVVLVLLRGAAAVIHTLMFYEVASQGVQNFPEYEAVGRLNGVEFAHYDIEKKQEAYTQDWMDTVAALHPHMWDEGIDNIMNHQIIYKDNLQMAEWRLGLKGVRMFQVMVGCQWDDQTNQISGVYQDAYDGEDFLSYNLEKGSWDPAKEEASPTMERWNSEPTRQHYTTTMLRDTCIGWMKTLLEAGHTVVNRTEPPSVSFLQRTPSSPIRCSATGFFPKQATVFWRKDGKELDQNVKRAVVLPNHDGTFQTAADLTLPPNQTDLHRYDCVFQFTEHKKKWVYKLNKSYIRTNHGNTRMHAWIVCDFIIIIMLGLVVYLRKRKWR